MSLAEPTAVAALLPASCTLVAVPHACPPADDSAAPGGYAVTVAIADIAIPGVDEPAAFAGPTGLRDTVGAIYLAKGGDPSNKAALTALAKQLYTDLCSWRLPRFDRTYVGSIAIPPDPTIDEVEFGYDGASGAWTRIKSGPLGDEPTEFNHADPADCPRGVVVYAANPKLSVANGNLVFAKQRVTLAPGGRRFRVKALGTDSIVLCPAGSSSSSNSSSDS